MQYCNLSWEVPSLRLRRFSPLLFFLLLLVLLLHFLLLFVLLLLLVLLLLFFLLLLLLLLLLLFLFLFFPYLSSYYLISFSDPGSDEPLPTEVMLALCRVFSGVLKRDSNLYLLNGRYDPFACLSEVRLPHCVRYWY